MISESWPNAAHRRYLKTRYAHWSERSQVLIRMPLVLSAEVPGSRKHSMRRWQSLHSLNSKERTIRSGWHKSMDACTNLKAASKILSDCYQRAQNRSGSNSLHDALSCYYSGNFQTGYRHGYVDKVRANAGISTLTAPVVPSIREAETKSKDSSTLVATGDNSSTGLIF